MTITAAPLDPPHPLLLWPARKGLPSRWVHLSKTSHTERRLVEQEFTRQRWTRSVARVWTQVRRPVWCRNRTHPTSAMSHFFAFAFALAARTRFARRLD